MFVIHTILSDLVKDEEVRDFMSRIPKIQITNGEVSAEVEQPYYFRNADTNDVLAIIDTTGTVTSIDDPNTFLLLKKDSLIVRQNAFESMNYDLSQIEDFTLSSEVVMRYLQVIAKYAVIVMFPLAVLFSYVYRIIQVLIYGAIGMIFTSACNLKLPYEALLRLAVVAVTPCIIVVTALSFTIVRLPTYLYLIAALLYLFFGVKSIQLDGPSEESILRPDDIIDN